MPRAVRDPEEVETRSSVRTRTRAAAAVELNTIESSPDSLNESNSQPSARLTRSKAVTTGGRTLRPRINSVSSDKSESIPDVKIETLKGASRKSLAASSPVKTVRLRAARAGSEVKATPPALSLADKRVTRSSSVDPVANPNEVGTPSKRRILKRVSMVPLDHTKLEVNTPTRKKAYKSLDNTLVENDEDEDFIPSSQVEKTEKSISHQKYADKDSSNVKESNNNSSELPLKVMVGLSDNINLSLKKIDNLPQPPFDSLKINDNEKECGNLNLHDSDFEDDFEIDVGGPCELQGAKNPLTSIKEHQDETHNLDLKDVYVKIQRTNLIKNLSSQHVQEDEIEEISNLSQHIRNADSIQNESVDSSQTIKTSIETIKDRDSSTTNGGINGLIEPKNTDSKEKESSENEIITIDVETLSENEPAKNITLDPTKSLVAKTKHTKDVNISESETDNNEKIAASINEYSFENVVNVADDIDISLQLEKDFVDENPTDPLAVDLESDSKVTIDLTTDNESSEDNVVLIENDETSTLKSFSNISREPLSESKDSSCQKLSQSPKDAPTLNTSPIITPLTSSQVSLSPNENTDAKDQPSVEIDSETLIIPTETDAINSTNLCVGSPTSIKELSKHSKSSEIVVESLLETANNDLNESNTKFNQNNIVASCAVAEVNSSPLVSPSPNEKRQSNSHLTSSSKKLLTAHNDSEHEDQDLFQDIAAEEWNGNEKSRQSETLKKNEDFEKSNKKDDSELQFSDPSSDNEKSKEKQTPSKSLKKNRKSVDTPFPQRKKDQSFSKKSGSSEEASKSSVMASEDEDEPMEVDDSSVYNKSKNEPMNKSRKSNSENTKKLNHSFSKNASISKNDSKLDESSNKNEVESSEEDSDEAETGNKKEEGVDKSPNKSRKSLKSLNESVQKSKNESNSFGKLNESQGLDEDESDKDEEAEEAEGKLESKVSKNKSLNKSTTKSKTEEKNLDKSVTNKSPANTRKSLNASTATVNKSANKFAYDEPPDREESDTVLNDKDKFLQKSIEQMKLKNPPKLDCSTLAQCASTSDEEENRRVPSLLSQKSNLTEKLEDLEESESDSDTSIAKELNLAGKDISYEDANVPFDECRASEEESDDSDDNDSDLGEFIVSDGDEDDEEEDDDDDEDDDDEDEKENDDDASDIESSSENIKKSQKTICLTSDESDEDLKPTENISIRKLSKMIKNNKSLNNSSLKMNESLKDKKLEKAKSSKDKNLDKSQSGKNESLESGSESESKEENEVKITKDKSLNKSKSLKEISLNESKLSKKLSISKSPKSDSSESEDEYNETSKPLKDNTLNVSRLSVKEKKISSSKLSKSLNKSDKNEFSESDDEQIDTNEKNTSKALKEQSFNESKLSVKNKSLNISDLKKTKGSSKLSINIESESESEEEDNNGMEHQKKKINSSKSVENKSLNASKSSIKDKSLSSSKPGKHVDIPEKNDDSDEVEDLESELLALDKTKEKTLNQSKSSKDKSLNISKTDKGNKSLNKSSSIKNKTLDESTLSKSVKNKSINKSSKTGCSDSEDEENVEPNMECKTESSNTKEKNISKLNLSTDEKNHRDKSILKQTSANLSKEAQDVLSDSHKNKNDDSRDIESPSDSDSEDGEDSYQIIQTDQLIPSRLKNLKLQINGSSTPKMLNNLKESKAAHEILEDDASESYCGADETMEVLKSKKTWKLIPLNSTRNSVAGLGDETPTTKYLKKSKLNATLPSSLHIETAENSNQQQSGLNQESTDDNPKKRKLADLSFVTNEIAIKPSKKSKHSIGQADIVDQDEPQEEKKLKKQKKDKKTEVESKCTEETEESEIKKKKKKKKKDKIISDEQTKEPNEDLIKGKKNKTEKNSNHVEEADDESMNSSLDSNNDHNDEDKALKKALRALAKLNSEKSKSASKQTKTSKKKPENINSDDEAPDCLDFSTARESANTALKQVEKSIQIMKQALRKKQAPSGQKGMKRLSDDVLNELDSQPVLHRSKRQKLCKDKEKTIMPSKSMFSPGKIFPDYLKVDSDDELLPSSAGGTTRFGVVDLRTIKKATKKNAIAKSFKDKMLARNSREPMSAYLMNAKKQATKGGF